MASLQTDQTNEMPVHVHMYKVCVACYNAAGLFSVLPATQLD